MRLVLCALFSLSLAACVTAGRAVRIDSCRDDPALHGSWRSYRMSQLGPAWIDITFADGCRYRTTARLLFMRSRENGNYRVEGDVIVFTRSSGETRWPYRLEGERLLLQESPEEKHVYERR